MKKQQLKSLTLQKSTISNFDQAEINGGISGGACGSHGNSACCPHSYNINCRETDQRTCTNSVVHCAA
ncbi:hypothetical protein [Kordia jejudonensis]|uniref:hypothetical protein n=1 Tax=Kordia jejudonensis TaxID=1348245 RepID=UPI0006290EB3|nr:hypothetical protein [Kordia jejudonensis]